MHLLKATVQLLVTEHVLEDLGFLTKSAAKGLHAFAGDAKQCDDEYVASGLGRFVQAPHFSECLVAVRVAKSSSSLAP